MIWKNGLAICGCLAVLTIGTTACTHSVPAQESEQNPQSSAKQDSPKSESAKAESDTTDDKAEETKLEYVRIRRNEKNLAVALETSVVSFADSQKFPGATVDLIGAIHLGEAEYYSNLNRLFSEYDALLFEAVMPEEAVRRDLRPGSGGAGRRPVSDEEEWTEAKIGLTAISVLQLGMKDALGLEFQLAGINYARKNFVHADMTAEEFEATMKQRGESFSQMLAREMAKALAAQNEQNPLAMNLDLMLSVLSSDRLYRVRRIAAVQLAKAGEGEAFAGPDGTSTIITERNIKALQILTRELGAGHKKIGIFYGAGHLADMEERLLKEFEFVRTGESWLTAWNLRSAK